ncbi:YncE family protein [Pelobium sp.]|nr:YncE family protein [Pelobium sp.]MDA9555039.1 YncE family protein [Pelobium sp.]
MLKTFIAIALVSAIGYQVKAQTVNYHILRKDIIGGTGGWDYININPTNHQIYVSHGNRITVLNSLTGDSVGVVSPTLGVHGVTFINALGKGYTSNGRANTVSVFDLKTNKILSEIAVGQNPDAIFYDDFSKKIFTCNGRSSDASVVDPKTEKVVATIPLGGKPETAVSDGKGNIFVNIEDKSEVVQFDAKTYTIKNRWKLGKGEEPTGLEIDRSTNRLFVGCGNKWMVVLDAKSGKILSQLAIGEGCDGIAFDQTKKLVFASNGEGTVTIVKELNANKFEVVQTVVSAVRARTITVDQESHKVYLPTAEFAKPTSTNARPALIPGTFYVLEIGE